MYVRLTARGLSLLRGVARIWPDLSDVFTTGPNSSRLELAFVVPLFMSSESLEMHVLLLYLYARSNRRGDFR